MKLRIKILLALIISILTGYLMFFVCYLLIQPIQLKYIQEVYIYNLFLFAYVTVSSIISLMVFYLLLGKRIRYIVYLHQQIQIDPSGIKVKGHDELSVLAEKIKCLFQEKEDSYAKEKKAEQEKYNLISSLSHDIRTPLTAIIGYLELTKEQIPDHEYLDIAYRRSKQLSFLANSLFDYVKISSKEYRPNMVEFNVVLLLQQLIMEYLKAFEERGIMLEQQIPDKELLLEADPDATFRALDNLFQNALKYASTYLRLQVTEKENTIRILLENDTNRKVDRHKISEKFYKGPSDHFNASGLGLYIARSLTEKNGGEIRISPTGNIFSIEISLPKKTQNS